MSNKSTNTQTQTQPAPWQPHMKRTAHPTIASVIRDHRSTDKSVGGFLNECTCGEGVDDYAAHWQDVILKTIFPNLAAIHQRLITEPEFWSPKLRAEIALEEAQETLDQISAFAASGPDPRDEHASVWYNNGVFLTKNRIRTILNGDWDEEDNTT